MKLAVFDCDGTLIDGQAAICDAMAAAFAQCGLPPPDRNRVRRVVGLSLLQSARDLLPDRDEALHRDVAEAYRQAFRAAREAGALVQPMFDGMANVLETLATRGWTLGVATGMSDRGLAHCLAIHGIGRHFATLQTADRHPSKPHPAMLEAALAETVVPAEAAVMIGDTAYDMQMACDAGVRAIGVAWGYHEAEELAAAGAVFVARSPAHLQEYLLS